MNYNYYPTTYPMYQPQQQTGLTWCQGIEAAKAWYVAPNTTVDLWDSEAQTIYIKSADASGMPSMKILDYTIRDPQKPVGSVSEPKVDYLTRDDLNALYEQISELREEIDSLSIRRTPKRKEIIEE